MKQNYPLALLFILISSVSFSQVLTTGNWKTIGNTKLSVVKDDANNGDGANDGAIYVDGKDTATPQGVSFTFDGTMTFGETINIETVTYNRNASYVRFTVGLYNVTSNVQLALSSEVDIANASSSAVSTILNYTAKASDVGDKLEVRYYRTSKFDGYRNFVIDNLKLNGNYISISLATTCPFTLTPDLDLLPSNSTIESEINTAVDRFSDAYLGTSAPSASALTLANNNYAALNISVSGGVISGDVISRFNELDFLKTYAQHLKFNPEDTNIKTKANNTVWLAGKQFCSGTLARNNQMYEYAKFARPASLLLDFLDADVQALFEYTLYEHSVQFKHFWEASFDSAYQEVNGAINTDLIYNISDAMLAYSLWFDTADERYRYMRAYKRYIERFFTHTSGTNDGLKPDGSGFHHWTAYNNYMYAYNTAASLLSYLDGTNFQVEQSNYEVFRDAFYAQFMQANDTGVQGLATAGRNPQSRMRSISQSALKTLAIAGGNILGLGTADPILAGLYNRIYGVDGDFNYSTVAPFEEGFFQFNHASAGAFRKNGWVAFTKGFTDNMWGAETYTNRNRYGRYQSYGTLEIIYNGDRKTGNGYAVDTWNWNYNPGTTVIRLPWANLHAERGRIDEMQQKRFVGTLNLKNKNSDLLTNNHGYYGLFAMDFKELEGQGFSTVHSGENHNATFTFKKSNFFFDDMIVCLASGINNDDTSNQTITTLYQRLDNSGTPNVNGATQSSSGEITFYGASNNWLLSNYNTGFYILNGSGDLKVKKDIPQTPSYDQIWPNDTSLSGSDTYYTGYIDHGTSPTNAEYEYILKPGSSVSEMQALHTTIQGGNKPYAVHQKDASAHIVEHISKQIFGYALFGSVSGLTYGKVKAVNASCLLMTNYENTSKKLQLSIVEPDLGFASRSYTSSITKVKNVTIYGEWVLDDTYPGVQIVSSNGTETVVEFTLVDGLSKEILLKDPNTLSVTSEILEGVYIYPNPASNVITIKSQETLSSVRVYNILGREIDLFYKNSLANKTINVSNYSKGIYFIKVEINGNEKTIKFVKN